MTTPFENAVNAARGIVQQKHGEIFSFTPRAKTGPNAGVDDDVTRAAIAAFIACFYHLPEDVLHQSRGGGVKATHMPHASAELSVFYTVNDCPEARIGDHVTREKTGIIYKVLKIERDELGGADMFLTLAK